MCKNLFDEHRSHEVRLPGKTYAYLSAEIHLPKVSSVVGNFAWRIGARPCSDGRDIKDDAVDATNLGKNRANQK
jgi:hypothetical protein